MTDHKQPGSDPNSTRDALAAFGPLRVVELGTWLAAPSAAALFADLGAEVIKVEPASGDPLRKFPGSMRGGEEQSPGFTLLNRHKKSVTLDITTDAGRQELDTLLAAADVLITNMRNGALERASLDPVSVTQRFPRLVYGSLTGLGLSGPDRERPGFDTGAFWARSGMLHQVTADGSEPLAPVGGYGDLMTSLSLFSATMVALFDREKTGRGGIVEASLLQTGGWLLSGDVAAQSAFGRAPKARPRAKSSTPLVNTYQTADHRWFFLTAVEAGRHLDSVCRAIDRPELSRDERFTGASAMRTNAAALIAIFDEAFLQKNLEYWTERFDREGVWWEKVATPAELMQDRQVAANDMVGDLAFGPSVIRAVLAPFRILGRRSTKASLAPELGADTQALLGREAVKPAVRRAS
ncbi:MAG: coA-transferase family protein [Hydrocarboniphaga sp.]|uniref:CaiB/BaiF CoA transferase family protein n=1 Tax=Hydrocarboniphaga sp. TaxID=2033016 RepID=UPI00262F195E|nr:CoA transferase [Hydrocarboniphaga sp.]MDB5970020.1 coA-transferase family protein [Hydrocarboniphaga sp.]